MENKNKEKENLQETEKDTTKKTPDSDWPHQTIQDLEDFIESQGIYIRQ